MVTVAGTFRLGRIDLERTPFDARDNDRVLVTFPESKSTLRKPVQLFGTWKNLVPTEPNIDLLLNDIRGEWIQEINDQTSE